MPYPERTTMLLAHLNFGCQAIDTRGEYMDLSGYTSVAMFPTEAHPGADVAHTFAICRLVPLPVRFRLTRRLFFSEYGEKYSQRSPKLKVRFDRARQSSCPYQSQELPRR